MSEVEIYEDEGRSIAEYWAILRRRRRQVIVPVVVLGLITIGLTFGLPAIYKSQAMILIEDQQVPREFVTSTITSFAAQRVQVISQRVLTVQKIKEVAQQYRLYLDKDTGRHLPSTTMAERFMEDMSLELVSADVIDPRSGRPTEATIAFTLSFEHESGEIAQRVTSELVTVFLDENLRTRTERAASTEDFLAAEADSLNQELLLREQELATFKEANEGALPELYNFNLSTLDRTSREIEDVDLRLRELENRRVSLVAEIAQVSPTAPLVLTTGEIVLSDYDRLKSLRSEFRQVISRYRSNHPDVARLESQIAQLEAELGVEEGIVELSESLREALARSTDLKQRMRADSPEIAEQERIVEEIVVKLQEAEARQGLGSQHIVPDNPAYVFLQTQIDTIQAEEASLKLKRDELSAKIQDYERLLSRAPEVERVYQGLVREYESARLKFSEARAKQREAKVAQNLEQERKGERFTLVEPPSVPVLPDWPNRPLVLVIGLLVSLSAGVGFAVLFEVLDRSVRGESQLADVTGGYPFAVVNYIETKAEIAARQFRTRLLLGSGSALASLALVLTHYFYRPLDVLWYMFIGI